MQLNHFLKAINIRIEEAMETEKVILDLKDLIDKYIEFNNITIAIESTVNSIPSPKIAVSSSLLIEKRDIVVSLFSQLTDLETRIEELHNTIPKGVKFETMQGTELSTNGILKLLYQGNYFGAKSYVQKFLTQFYQE